VSTITRRAGSGCYDFVLLTGFETRDIPGIAGLMIDRQRGRSIRLRLAGVGGKTTRRCSVFKAQLVQVGPRRRRETEGRGCFHRRVIMKRLFLPFALLLLVSPCFSADAQVEFVAKLVSVSDVVGDDVGTLHLQLTPTFNLDVKVTEITEIRGEGDVELALADLKADMLLRIEGVFAEGGILAKEITAINFGVNKFSIRGTVEAVDTSKQELKVLGLTVKVTGETEIKDAEGELIELAGIQVGDVAWIEGKLTNDGLVAEEIRIRTLEFKPPRLVFEGVITELEEDSMVVQLKGVDDIPVTLTDETQVKGELAEGAYVRVAGVLASNLSVTATKITVFEPLQLAPSHLRMKPGQTMPVITILRSHPDEDVTLQVTSKDPAIADVSAATVVIPAGKVVGGFRVTAKAEGTTTIEVKLPASLGGGIAELSVEVKTQGNEDKEGKADVRWQPNSIKIRTGLWSIAFLVLNRPVEAELVVPVTVQEGDGSLVEGLGTVTIPAGKRFAPFLITAKSTPGVLVLRATLPEAMGSDYADLRIEVKAAK